MVNVLLFPGLMDRQVGSMLDEVDVEEGAGVGEGVLKWRIGLAGVMTSGVLLLTSEARRMTFEDLQWTLSKEYVYYCRHFPLSL